MKCAKVEDVVLYVTNQLSGDRYAELESHLGECEGCQRLLTEVESMTGRLAETPGEFEDDQLVGDVMTLVRLGQARKEKLLTIAPRLPADFRVAIPAIAAVLVVCTVAVFIWSERSEQVAPGGTFPAQLDTTSGFQARGGAEHNPAEHVSFKIFKATASGYRKETAKIASSDSLAFAYDNHGDRSYRYLMIVGVDHQGDVFWYYPAYQSAKENPESIPIRQSDKTVELPDEIKHNLKPGKLRIFALFSKTPLHVKSVEKKICEDFKHYDRIELLKRLSGYDIAQTSFLLEVAKR